MAAAGVRMAQRLCTAHGTLLYVDERARELRHGGVDSPGNALLVSEGGPSGLRARLMHATGNTAHPLFCGADRSLLPIAADPATASQVLELMPVEPGFVALRLNGVYLCPEADGRITLSRRDRGPWERFRTLDREAPIEAIPEIASARAEAAGAGPASRRYHLGCGPLLVPGWLNVDHREELPRDGVFQVDKTPGAYFCNRDLSRGLPGADNSLDFVYHSHFLEHLAYPDAINLLREIRFRLRPGGRMRLLVPDLELWIRNYATNNTEFFAAYRRMVLGDNPAAFPTKGSILIGMMHGFGHRSGFDFETLQHLLGAVGFTDIRRTGFQQSSFPDLQALEPRNPLRELESLCVECTKAPS